MRRSYLLAGLIALIPALAQAKTRCGWLQNPPPANWLLVDAGGAWWIASMGLDSDRAIAALPQISEREWVSHGDRGYGNGCP